ncbi:myosin phosphatase Rho-interacting protein isoform X2 [Trichomycterus rosablanca]|uniref:myosin phosphatase Rho-interacting protein isoform X2 n=1 Tax=Trichomycterus rosablanca TaxID=2290929 RepID=UPI002F34F5E7
MSTTKENPCRKFQANIFNKSKCQNCFKPRELHLLTDPDLNQAKPIYGGWLCLAPEGTDFDNPMQRSRKWQRRFFVLYEHGCLRFALDESPSTLPQGTVNMNLCTDVIDAEPKTGQKNALCIITPEQEYYIRGDSKEIINGWTEQLIVYPRTNKQNQKKKRKVEPTTSQEPGPAKVAMTGSSIPEAEKVPDSSSIIWQEELQSREVEVSPAWSSADVSPLGSLLPSAADEASVGLGSDQGSVNGDELDRAGFSFPPGVPQSPRDLVSPTAAGVSGGVPRCPSPAHSEPFPSGSSLLSNGSHISGSVSSLDSDASADSHALPRARCRPEKHREAVFSPERSGRSNVIEKLEALELENAERMEVEETGRGQARQGRSEVRRFQRQEQKPDSAQDLDFHPSTLPPLRRAKSLDRRTTESVMTPDLLNFKKGWMVKLDEQGQWKKYWFVLTDHSLRYYKDSIAEEASDLDGEIDLSTCHNVTEYQAQRNYGFQIHTQEGVHTLSAMTAGIRRNWIQAVMKNVRPSTAPDVASLTDEHGSFGPFEALVRPDVTQDSPSSEASSVEREPRKSRARERRREGRSKTFDWAEFRPIAQALAQQRAQEADALHAQLADGDRTKRREERRRRYESVTGVLSLEPAVADTGGMDVESGSACPLGSVCPPSPERQQKVEEEIEQRWQEVEKTPIRDERRVPLSTALRGGETAELEKLLESYKKGVEDLKSQLETCHQQLRDSNQHKLELEEQLKSAQEREQQIRVGYISPLESPLSVETKPQTKKPELVSSQARSLARKYQETKELLQLQEVKKRNMQAQLGLSLPQTPPASEILTTKTVTLALTDSEAKIQELEDLLDSIHPLSVKDLVGLLRSHGHALPPDLPQGLQSRQEPENETVRGSLARAGDSIRDHDMLGRVRRTETLGAPRTPACHQEEPVDLLTSENEALNQRCQEIVNQLREADREIDRLKAELRTGQDATEALNDFYRRQLGDKSQELEEALVKLEILGNSLKETEKKLQLKEATLEGLGFQDAGNETIREVERLRSYVELMESKLHSAEEICSELQAQNTELQRKNQEAERTLNQVLLDVEEGKRTSKEREVVGVDCERQESMESAERRVEEVLKRFKRRSEALNEVLDLLKEPGSSSTEPEDGSMTVLLEQEVLSELLGGFKNKQVGEGDAKRTLDVVEQMRVENQILGFLTKLPAERNTGTSEGAEVREKCSPVIMKELIMSVQSKATMLENVASTVTEPAMELLRSLASDPSQEEQWSQCVRDAILDVACMYQLVRQEHQRKNDNQIQPDVDVTTAACSSCSQLMRQNTELKAQLEQTQNQMSSLQRGTQIQIAGEPIDSQDKAVRLQDLDAKHKKELSELRRTFEEEVTKAEETLRLRYEENVKEIDSLTACMENLKRKHETERDALAERFDREMTELYEAVEPLGADLPDDARPSPALLKRRIRKLVARVAALTEETKRRGREDDAAALRLKYDRDLENLKATCERGFAAMEESHQKVVDELQRKHQRELESLQEEKERLLAEETAATIAAIEAMKNAHRNELERELDKARKTNSNNENADIEEIRRQHEEELLSFQREIEVLSEQYSQKCLENAHLAQALEAERQALRQCQRENQELNAHNQELNNRLAAEITKMRSMSNEDGEHGTVIQGKELYELEVMLRVKESEVQYLKQEINSLKDELQAAQRDKKYATDKYKDIYTELSIVKAKAERDLGKLKEQLQLAHEALGEPSPEEVQHGGYDIMKSKSNPDILKMAAAAAKRSERTTRSKSLKEGLTAEQRLHLFDNKDTKEF